MIRLEISFPPSVNSLFPGKHRRYRSGAYDAWKIANGWEIQAQKPGRLNGPVRIDIKLETGRKQDLDNCSKAVLDLLKTNGVIEDDGPKYVRDLRLRFDCSVTGAVVEIFPIPERVVSVL